jgi:hypothetical protein
MTDQNEADDPTTSATEVLTKWSPPNGEKLPEGFQQIHRALFAAKCALPAIAKNGKLELGGKEVPFTRWDDIKKAVGPVLERFGVMVYIQFVDSHSETMQASEPKNLIGFSDVLGPDAKPTGEKLMLPRDEVRDGKIPNTRFREKVVYDVNFICVADNSGAVVRVIGEAYDTNSDKATGKATTAAIKRAYVETFGIVDGKEPDPDETTGDEGNRAATTDRREAGEGDDRGAQQRAAAAKPITGRSGPARSVTTNPVAAIKAGTSEEAAESTGADVSTGEVPEEAPIQSELDRLGKAKERLVAANKILGYSSDVVNQIATEVTGKATRPEWIVLVTAVEKIADELEKRANDGAGMGQFVGGEPA